MLFFKKSSSGLAREYYHRINTAYDDYQDKKHEAWRIFYKNLEKMLNAKKKFVNTTPQPRSMFSSAHEQLRKIDKIKSSAENIFSCFEWDNYSFSFTEKFYEDKKADLEEMGGIVAFPSCFSKENSLGEKLKQTLIQELTKAHNKRSSGTIYIEKRENTRHNMSFRTGLFLNGKLTCPKGNLFEESSICFEIINIRWEDFYKAAEKIQKKFKADSLMVKDTFLNQIGFLYASED